VASAALAVLARPVVVSAAGVPRDGRKAPRVKKVRKAKKKEATKAAKATRGNRDAN
jgi:hypothetical protein